MVSRPAKTIDNLGGLDINQCLQKKKQPKKLHYMMEQFVKC